VEFLVSMTTQVPEGTPEGAVDEVKAREAENSARLAEQRRLLRLWRPPLGPGEWRSFGLFAADDGGDLETVLAGMPLRIWRTDQVTPLAPHPNDPAEVLADDPTVAEFLTEFRVAAPEGAARGEFEKAEAGEAERTRELARQSHLVRLWKLENPPDAAPGATRALGLWRAEDGQEMRTILASLPLDPWLTVETTPLTRHPSDPGHNAA
jgi:muconolactone delta-isomerase